MGVRSHLYRRGQIYWYRRVHILFHSVKIDVRISLRTGQTNEARQLADVLDGQFPEVKRRLEAEMEQLNSNAIPPETSARILSRQGRQIYCYALSRGIETVRELGCSPDELRLATKTKRRIWDFARTHTGSPGHLANYVQRLRDMRVPALEIDEFEEVAKASERRLLNQPPADMIEVLAREAGLPLSDSLAHGLKIMWLKEHYDAAVRLAWLVEKGADLEPEYEALRTGQRALLQEYRRDRNAANDPPAPCPAPSDPVHSEPHGVVPEHIAPSVVPPTSSQTFGEFTEELITDRLSGDARIDASDFRTAAQLFVFSMKEDKPVSQISQQDLRTLVMMLRSMPKRWGQTKGDQEGGLEAVMARAATLPPEALRLSPQTEAKHLSRIHQVLKFAAASGVETATQIDISAFRKERKKEINARGRGRENWEPEEFIMLLSSPSFRGCKGPTRADRHKPGPYRYHDADYWMPLMLGLMGGRSNEFGGLLLDDIDVDGPIPSIRVWWNGERDVKTKASLRTIPVHSELVRLGFIDYVKALRSQGQTLLFPELKFCASSLDFSKAYYKHFIYLRQSVFPASLVPENEVAGPSSKCVHSFRGMTADLLDEVKDEHVLAILGHEQKTTKAKVYRKFQLETLLQAMEPTGMLTKELEPFPITLNPHALEPRKKHRAGHVKAAASAKLGPTP